MQSNQDRRGELRAEDAIHHQAFDELGVHDPFSRTQGVWGTEVFKESPEIQIVDAPWCTLWWPVLH